VLTITAYSEPIPVDYSYSEPPRIQEKDEQDESSSFAEMLAGLVQNAQSENKSHNENAFDALSAAKSTEESNLNLFADWIESGIDLNSIAQEILPDDLPLEQNFIADNLETDIDFSDIDNELQNILNSGHQLNVSLDAELNAEENAVIQNLANAKKTDVSSELQAEIASTVKNTEATDAESLIAANLAKDADSGKKVRNAGEAQSSVSQTEVKKENSEAVSKNNANENAAAFSKKDDPDASRLSKLDEARNRMRKDRVSLEVRDLRTGQGVSGNTDKGYVLVETAAGRTFNNASPSEITLDLRLPDYSHNAQAQTTWEAKAGPAVENMLARELHQNFNGDIVRHASIALRDGGAGTIKIALHPETLGNVKIHLELSDNKITGQIIVESQEALNAFRKEIAALEQAFKDSGFADANLDLSFTADGADNQEFDNNSYLRQVAAGNYEGSYDLDSSSVIDVFFGHRTGSINMLA